ncbi:MAG TPA: DUF6786 family protein [Spirochaetia bacterium]|nr:DUF6786 family protein [Spirochaetia bacterium]
MSTRVDLQQRLETAGISYQTAEANGSWMIVAPALGARILGAGTGEENAFWTAPVLAVRPWADGGNAGGQRTWIAPEGGPLGFFFSNDLALWKVPPALDPGNYFPQMGPPGSMAFRSSFVAEAADGRSYQISITRAMSLQTAQIVGLEVARIRFRHEISNTGTRTLDKCIGLWSIIQIPAEAGGTILLALRDTAPSDLDGVRACYTPIPPEMIRRYGQTVLLRTGCGRKYKVGVPASFSTGVVASIRPCAEPDRGNRRWILTAKKFAVRPSETYVDMMEADNGHAAQAYNDPGLGAMAFCEIESHAPAPALTPGQSQAADIEILIAMAEERPLRRIIADELRLDCPRDVFEG